MQAQLLFMVLQSRKKRLSLAEKETEIRKKWFYNFVHSGKAIILLFLLDSLAAPLCQPTQIADNKHNGEWVQTYLPTSAAV